MISEHQYPASTIKIIEILDFTTSKVSCTVICLNFLLHINYVISYYKIGREYNIMGTTNYHFVWFTQHSNHCQSPNLEIYQSLFSYNTMVVWFGLHNFLVGANLFPCMIRLGVKFFDSCYGPSFIPIPVQCTTQLIFSKKHASTLYIVLNHSSSFFSF